MRSGLEVDSWAGELRCIRKVAEQVGKQSFSMVCASVPALDSHYGGL